MKKSFIPSSARNTNPQSNRIIDEQTSFSVSEAYRNLRTNLFFAVPGRDKCKTVLTTSSVSGEGKTSITINLAITIAHAEKRVLIIDCDLRKPKIERYLEVKTTKGLSNYLSGQADVADIVYTTKHKNLSLVPSGIIPPNPSELLSRKEFAELIQQLKSNYDFIFFDTPPLNDVSDALVVVPHCDGVILAIKNNSSTHPILQRCIKKLEFESAKIFGFVLNGVEKKAVHGDYYGSFADRG